MAPIVGHDNGGPGRASDLGDVGVVDATAGDPIVRCRGQQTRALGRGKIVD